MKESRVAVPGITCVVLIDRFLHGDEPPLSRKKLNELIKKFGKYDEIFIAAPLKKVSFYESYTSDDETISIIPIENGSDERKLLRQILREISDFQYAIFHPINDPLVSPFILKIFEEMIDDHFIVIMRVKNRLDPWRAIYDIENVLYLLENTHTNKKLNDFLETTKKTLVIDDFALKSFERSKILYEKIEKAKDISKLKRRFI